LEIFHYIHQELYKDILGVLGLPVLILTVVAVVVLAALEYLVMLVLVMVVEIMVSVALEDQSVLQDLRFSMAAAAVAVLIVQDLMVVKGMVDLVAVEQEHMGTLQQQMVPII
jgi:hypothetical protein